MINDITRYISLNPRLPSENCMAFGLRLQSVFAGELYYNSGHVILKVGDKYYDHDGGMANERDKSIPFIPLAEYGPAHVKSLMIAAIETRKP